MKLTKCRAVTIIAVAALVELTFLHAEALRRGGILAIDVNRYGEGLLEVIALTALTILTFYGGWKA